MEILPVSTIEIPKTKPDMERLLIAARALWRACGESDTWDKVREHRQAGADLNRLLDHYPDGIHRDDKLMTDTLEHAVVGVT